MATTPPQQGGSIFTRKVGPLPLWGWIAIAVVGIYLYRRMSGGSSTSSSLTSTGPVTPEPTESVTLPGGVSASGTGSDIASLLNWLSSQQQAPVQGPTGPTTGAAGAGPTAGPAPGTAGASPGNGGGTPGQTSSPASAAQVDVYQSGAVYVWEPGQAPTPETGQGKLVSSFSDVGGQYFGGTNPGGGLPSEPYGYMGGQSPTPIASAAAAPGGGYTLVNTAGQQYKFGPGQGQFQAGVGFH